MKAEGRLTRYRKVVLEVLRSRKDHPTAAEVFRIVRRRRPGAAYATIYNALNWLERSGMIGRVNFSDDASHYDPVVERHDHLVCVECGALRDVKLKLPANLWSKAGKNQGFHVEHYRTELFGLCGQCAANAEHAARM
jgi:Fur family transcriptional regulator, peroxide stress response regulator